VKYTMPNTGRRQLVEADSRPEDDSDLKQIQQHLEIRKELGM
jgi:hypothetical protein